jgi:beta-N-acetylhexosaminidase
MTLLQKIGQLFILGFNGTTPSKGISELISKSHVGGVILFRRNLKTPSQAATLTRSLQSRSKRMPLFIGIDEEGGRVSRLPKGFTRFPEAALFGSLGDAGLAYKASQVTAWELRAVGINLNFAPVLDVLTEPSNPVIQGRAFGDKATLVSRMGLAVMAALQDNRVIACGKHFPGHGDTTVDSHVALPTVTLDKHRLQTVELRPFYHLIGNGLAMIMTAHVVYPSLDRTAPATLSARIIGRLLRKDLGFNGVVVTDDLEMKAISQEPGEAAVRAIEAGADLIILGHEEAKQRKALDAVQKAVK